MRLALIPTLLCALMGFTSTATAADAGLKDGDYVAVIGDSITEQKLYSLNIESYLLMCQPKKGLSATQFGWGGETAEGFGRRMANDCLRFKPMVATTCFGMNDGRYSPMDDGKAKWYRDNQRSVVKQLKDAGVRFIVLGSPGVVDSETFRKDPAAAEMYNKTLAALRDIDRDLAKEEGITFANVYDAMMEVMTKAKAKYGKAYHLAGGDGVHPDRNGHLVMAYAFLKALGCDGDIGTITVDLGKNSATASDGHKVQSVKDGAVEVLSERYPFCFYDDPAKTSSTRGVLEFMPFNQELNRFRLVVTNIGAPKAKVTWGKESHEYSAADLEKGVNLAADFLDNPFSEPFRQVEGVIFQKQNMETPLVKQALHDLPVYTTLVPDEKAAFERVADVLVKKDVDARAGATAAVKPVTHTVVIQAVK
ncbi:MAG TPA: SGNH/GDSL hydrolase family protein [Planctomycetota bacterium]|jgi:lysophospholipase L1-like esterase|nr:SGNH/GDSL hydrolase family protein [Planctomycetota bacterium]